MNTYQNLSKTALMLLLGVWGATNEVKRVDGLIHQWLKIIRIVAIIDK
jgi:hypothetical protein